ncbi:MAG: hypothetical protein Q4E67_07840, partial [Planctomycetia bacterium]|nr:hypothetical protein [Planctomycetia bacterium]
MFKLNFTKPKAGTILFSLVYAVGTALLLFKTKDISDNFNAEYPMQKYVFYIGFFGLLAVLAYIFACSVLNSRRKEAHLEKKPRPVWYYPVLSGVFALVVMSLGYVYLGMWPLGKESAMILDLHHQYGPLLSKMREMF